MIENIYFLIEKDGYIDKLLSLDELQVEEKYYYNIYMYSKFNVGEKPSDWDSFYESDYKKVHEYVTYLSFHDLKEFLLLEYLDDIKKHLSLMGKINEINGYIIF